MSSTMIAQGLLVGSHYIQHRKTLLAEFMPNAIFQKSIAPKICTKCSQHGWLVVKLYLPELTFCVKHCVAPDIWWQLLQRSVSDSEILLKQCLSLWDYCTIYFLFIFMCCYHRWNPVCGLKYFCDDTFVAMLLSSVLTRFCIDVMENDIGRSPSSSLNTSLYCSHTFLMKSSLVSVLTWRTWGLGVMSPRHAHARNPYNGITSQSVR